MSWSFVVEWIYLSNLKIVFIKFVPYIEELRQFYFWVGNIIEIIIFTFNFLPIHIDEADDDFFFHLWEKVKKQFNFFSLFLYSSSSLKCPLLVKRDFKHSSLSLISPSHFLSPSISLSLYLPIPLYPSFCMCQFWLAKVNICEGNWLSILIKKRWRAQARSQQKWFYYMTSHLLITFEGID